MNSITRDYSQLSSFARSPCIAYSLHIRGGTILQSLTLTAKRPGLLQHMQLYVPSILLKIICLMRDGKNNALHEFSILGGKK